MGKEGDLWDDSALINAFTSAISKYKTMHGIEASSNGKVEDNKVEEELQATEVDTQSKQFGGSNIENIQNDDKVFDAPETTAKIEETVELNKIKENHPRELTFSTDHVGTSNGQTGLSSISKYPSVGSYPPGNHTITSDTNIQNEAALNSNDQEEYNQLLNKYYEIEDQRQRILEQLNQYNNCYSQNPDQHQEAYVPQPYSTVACNCSYGCENWVAPCNSLPNTCLGGPCTDESCHGFFKHDEKRNSIPAPDHNYVQTAMAAAKTALSSLKLETSSIPHSSASQGDLAKCTEPATDLGVVLNAWYSAGFYTGKYLSEKSFENKKQG
ncbi:uncharacterized protein LOC127261376 [Andrographis paniculata]|uniref:uncharacterized protein LOC127261376 n=1 Tax=Andrographis paniculata TaxID=175694 RepID=UPI0021E92D72|nr:uncharacterized protein LOC127261376 [Andrographis paniculata]